MAKAGDDNSIDWPLHDAFEHVVRVYGSRQQAETFLTEQLGKGSVRWRAKYFEGNDQATLDKMEREMRSSPLITPFTYKAYKNGDPEFWRTSLIIDWQQSSARERFGLDMGARAYRISVSRADVLALLPEEPSEAAVGFTGLAGRPTSKKLCEDEMRRRANAGELLPTLGAECDHLERWLPGAHPNAPPAKAKTIRNSLRGIYRKLKKA